MTRKGQRVDGWLVLDKPAGISSAKAVAIARRLFEAAKVGHGGTLDPLATGILPIAFGEATKTVAWAMDGRKAYRVRARFGEARDTDDAEGAVIETSAIRPGVAALCDALPRFTGSIQQVPPDYSAIKVAGQRAYKLARADRPVALQPRPVEIDRLALVDRSGPDEALEWADLAVECGKGTYIRALVRDLARYLGTVAYVEALRRTRVGPFAENRAISLDSLEALGHSPARFEHLLPVETALDDIPALAVTEEEASRLRHGQALAMLRTGIRDTVPGGEGGPVLRAMLDRRLVALVRIDGGSIRSVRVINP
jgi:tRNA pseudouridine55 synthase